MGIDDFKGRLLDCDSHLYLTPQQCPDAMGAEFAERYLKLEQATFGDRDVVVQGRGRVFDDENVWSVKGWDNPGCYDAVRRIWTLDLMGVRQQLLFPDGLFASVAASRTPGADAAARRYNDYILDWAAPYHGRLRPGAVLQTHDVAATLAEARRTIDAGAYAVILSCGRPPAGRSPADPEWEPLWAMLAEAGVPALLHVGCEAGFLDTAWGRLPSLNQDNAAGPEGGPFAMATCHLAAQVYLTAMILGGVFERHPRLRFGVIELTAQWVGPLAEMLDHRVDVFARPMSQTLALRPSEYLSRQVRVTPFWWEPVDLYIDRYGLSDVYVFSTDFPHVEGGTDPLGQFHGRMARLGSETLEKFFVTNGSLLLS